MEPQVFHHPPDSKAGANERAEFIEAPDINAGIKIYYCRKVFVTFLRKEGIEPEIIDLLQGRISSSVFVNHYYRPDINEMIVGKIGPALSSLSKCVENFG